MITSLADSNTLLTHIWVIGQEFEGSKRIHTLRLSTVRIAYMSENSVCINNVQHLIYKANIYDLLN